MLSAFIAGLSGGFLALSVGSVHPDTFGLDLSIAILANDRDRRLELAPRQRRRCRARALADAEHGQLPAPTDLPLLGGYLPAAFKTFPTYAAGVYYGVALILIMILMPYGLAGAYWLLHRLDRVRFDRPAGGNSAVQPEEAAVSPSAPQTDASLRAPSR